jgi:signal transduction histidine kinase
MLPLPKSPNLQTKFVFGMVVTAFVLGSLFSAGSYFHMRSVLEEEVRDKARLIFAHLDSIQRYVRDVLRPAMYEHFPSSFIIEAMSSSYISRQIMSPERGAESGSLFRRVAMDARNPDYEANQLERELIRHFQTTNTELWQGYQQLNGERYYVMARPVRFTQQCLYCHGAMKDAPVELINLYGKRGFNKELDVVAGVDLVATSEQQSIGRVRQILLTYFAFFAVGTLLFFFTSNLLFRLLVVKKLKRVNSVFKRHTTDVESTALLHQLEQGDEVEELVDGIERLGEHLFEARGQLQHYAENLRKMVEERTAALSREMEARRADVQLFVRLLEDTYRSRSRAELWHHSLPRICSRFAARRIAYLCTMATQGHYSWPETKTPPTPPERFAEILTGGTCVVAGTDIFVPVESSTGNAEGLLWLSWETSEQAGQHDLNVLQALGRQLGTAAENLSAIDSLARQMNILETIVEGISDPLVLVDANCVVLTVNQAASRLLAELSDGSRPDSTLLSLFFDLRAETCPMRETISRGTVLLREVSLPNDRTFSLSLYPVRSLTGTTDQVVVFLRETTTERRMQQQIWHAEKMASVGKLTAGLAHEINNPLGVIRCYTGLLRQGIDNPQQLADLKIIERHTQQAQRVLQDLLNFSRPKATGSGQADAGHVAQAVGEVFSVQAANRSATITVERPEKALWVRLGVEELEQVIGNLVMNALDAMNQQGGKIHITVRRADTLVALEIADNGPGVASEDQSHIFDPFFSTKEIGAGTGLGLTIAYGIVTNVGGRIEIKRSTQLGGAIFTVLLPPAAEHGEINHAH